MKDTKKPTLFQALIPIFFLTALLSVNVSIFKDASLEGSNQIVLIISAAVATVIGLKIGYNWDYMLKGIIKSINSSMQSILILLMIGALSGTWLISGIVPMMIHSGIQLLNPTIFLFATCIVCATVSIATGSSWTTSATVGIALIGIGKALGIPSEMIAGAILSGAYFGDKLSPLSDTTNLAPAMAGTVLFTHIRYMTITTIPSIILALIVFLVMGFTQVGETQIMGSNEVLVSIEEKFYLTGWLYLVPLIVVILIVKKVPAIPSLLIGTLLGVLAAVVFQPQILNDLLPSQGWKGYFMAIMLSMYGEIQISTSDASVSELLKSGGMHGMLNTVWLILSAMTFGGVMESAGMLKVIAGAIIQLVNSTTSLIVSTVGTCLFFNITASDQYLAIVVPGRMYADIYRKKGLAPENLSRTLEDSGTVTSVLIPWNTCGAYHSSVLGVGTLAYLPYCIFNLVSPLMTILVCYFKYKFRRLTKK